MEETQKTGRVPEGMEIVDFPREGYQPLVTYDHWRVAVLKYCEDLKIEKIKTMQEHLYTDESFCLVSGRMIIFLAGRGELPGKVEAVELEPHKVYNIRKGTWHNHIMSPDGEALIIENSETYDGDGNSPIHPLTEAQIQEVYDAAGVQRP